MKIFSIICIVIDFDYDDFEGKGIELLIHFSNEYIKFLIHEDIKILRVYPLSNK